MADWEKVVRTLDQGITVSLSSIPLSIVVMGPGSDTPSPGATLRRAIIEYAAHYGIAVEPEHPRLTKTARNRMAAGEDLAAYEVYLVNTVDLVVLIPASAGSLCELGLFSMVADCHKFVILADAAHPRAGTYVSDGPLVAARNRKAEVEFVDYTDVDAAWGVVRQRIEKLRVKRGVERLIAEGE